MSHWGIPGPGGSLGKCAVCGGDFAAGVLMDMAGLPSGIKSFGVGFIEDTLYCHAPECEGHLRAAFEEAGNNPAALYELLPDGPLKNALGEGIQQLEENHATSNTEENTE